MNSKFVLIIFGNNAVAYNIASALVGSTIRPITFLPPVSIIPNGFSSKFDKFFIRKLKFSSHENLTFLIQFLNRHFSGKKILTFLTNDAAIEFWMKNQKDLSKYCYIGSKDLRPFYIKANFFSRLQEIGVFFPKTSISLSIFTKNDFPVIVKPAYKGIANNFINRFHNKVLTIESAEHHVSLSDFATGELIFQQKIDFAVGDEFSWCGYRNEGGEIYSATTQHLNKFPDKSGRISHIKIVKNNVLKQIGNNIVEKLGYVGIADIQFIFNQKSGRYYVIEMNPRLWCSHELLLMNNINLIRLYAEEYYQEISKFNPTNHLSGFENQATINWKSILYYAQKLRLFKLKNNEYFQIEQDNFFFRLSVFLFLRVKYFYHLIKKSI